MNSNRLKNLFILILVTTFSISIHAQDLILTSEGDSLNCKITKKNSENIYFTFKHKDEIRSTLLPLGQVKTYQYNFYQTSEVPSNKIVGNEMYPHFRTAINGGWSYRTARLADNIPSNFEQYMKELKSGYHYGIDLSYYFAEQLGLGFKYYNFRSKNELNNVYITLQDGSMQSTKISDDISINFIGPFFSTRFLDANKRNSFLMNFGLGYMGYTNKTFFISDFTIKSGTLGACWDIGYDISLSKNFALGFQLSYMVGTLTQYKMSDGVNTLTVKLEEGEYESLSRIDLSIGLRFNQ